MLDGSRGEDARAPGGVIGIERAGEVDAAFGGRAFAGDHAIADDGQSVGGGIAAGRLKCAIRGGLGTRGRHNKTSQFLVLSQHFTAGVNDWLTIRNRRFDIFKWLPICRFPPLRGSGPGVMRAIQGENGAEVLTFRRFFAAEAHFKRRC
jgi:hypothetical protein